MSEIHTRGNSILVDAPSDTGRPNDQMSPEMELVGWVVPKVSKWEDFRNQGYNRKWAEYWRMWRGQWSQEDKNRLSERSRLIAPALAQAIEMSVAEVEEAMLSREQWFDVVDDLADEQKLDATLARDQLTEDLDFTNAKDAASEAVLNSAIFGTGIMKVSTDVIEDLTLVRDQNLRLRAQRDQRVIVPWEPIRPDEFIPDPSATCISDMLGCAHKTVKPMHSVLEKIQMNIYRKEALAVLAPGRKEKTGHEVDFSTEAQANQTLNSHDTDSVEVLEYHGKVPLKLMNRLRRPETDLDILLELDDRRNDRGVDGPMVEAIVTIANGSVLLRAMVNPFVMQDRSIIAFQWERVPGRFWGRGVAEKGYNPQKALDAEMRARIDALGFVSAPMIGVDSGRVPRGFKMEVKPGKVWLTQGRPSEVLEPVQVGNFQPNTFNQTQELMQMVQMGTGAFDTATSLKNQSQSGASGATANSVFLGAFVKRAKRAIQNVERNLLGPAIRKSMLRYMQFAPERYPVDAKFQVKASLGIVAREVEQANLTQLMAMLPEQFPQVTVAVAQGIMDLSSVTNKAQILQAMEQALQPPSPEEQQQQQELQELQLEAAKAQATQELLENQKTLAEIRKILAEAEVATRRADVEDDKVRVEQARVVLQGQEIDRFAEQNEIARKRLELQEKQVEARIRQINSGGSGS